MIDLEVTAQHDGPSLVVRLQGELDLRTSPTLRTKLTEVIGQAARGGVVTVDLGGLDFMDSSGMSVLIGAHKQATGRGTRLVLARPSANVRKMLQITGLLEIFNLNE